MSSSSAITKHNTVYFDLEITVHFCKFHSGWLVIKIITSVNDNENKLYNCLLSAE